MQVTNRLQTALSRDRKLRLVKALLSGVATGGLAAAVAGLAAPHDLPLWTALGSAAGALGGAALLWRRAPQLIDMARRADRHLATDVAVETAVEGWAKNAPLNDVTALLRDRVSNATQTLQPAALVPPALTRPALAAAVGVALAFAAPLLPFAPAAPVPATAPDRAAITEGLTAIAALRDSEDATLNALAQEAEALLASMAEGADPEALAQAVAALQDNTAAVLAEATTDEADLAALEEALAQLNTRTSAGEEAPLPEDDTAYADDGPAWGDMDDVQAQNIDTPDSDLVTMPTRSDEGAIEDDTLSCEFGDDPTCSVRSEGERPAVQNSYDEDIPEQIGLDELTQGGDPTASIASAGDTGATGTAESAFYGVADPVSPLEAAFSEDTITLSADNPIAEGRRGRSDMTSEFEGGAVTRFPDAPVVGQPAWQRAPEQPVARMPIDPALGEAMRNYYPAPEVWR